MFSVRHVHKVLCRCMGRNLHSIARYQDFSTTTQKVSTAGDIYVDLNRKTGIAVMTVSHKPANTLTLEFLSEMKIALDQLEEDRDCRGLIFTSSIPGIFSAGIELTELYPLDEERFITFWRTVQDTWFGLYTSRLATMAALNGHTLAGGCLFSLGCDYRIMTKGKYTLGLNESQLGVPLPDWAVKAYSLIIGYRRADQAAMLGTRFSQEEGCEIGLVDQLSEPGDLLKDTQTEMAKWLQISDVSRQLIKEQQRGPLYRELMARRHEDTEYMRKVIVQEQQMLAKYLEQLKQKSKK